ncbi:MAG: hypothetical protein ACTSVI_03160 [Promethearchaeota archaeon]
MFDVNKYKKETENSSFNEKRSCSNPKKFKGGNITPGNERNHAIHKTNDKQTKKS